MRKQPSLLLALLFILPLLSVPPANAVTFTSADPTVDFSIITNSATGSPCPSASFSKENNTLLSASAGDSGSSLPCKRGLIMWPLTIPTNATIVSVVLRYDLRTVTNLDATHVQIRQINNNPNTTSAADLWTDAGGGTIILESISEVVDTNKVVNLGDFAVQDVQAKLAQAYWAISFQLNNETRIAGSTIEWAMASESHATPTPAPTLEIEYTFPTATQLVIPNSDAAFGLLLDGDYIGAFTRPYTDSVQLWFYVILTLVPVGVIWIRAGSIGPSTMLLVLFLWAATAATSTIYYPPEGITLIYTLIIVSIGLFFFRLLYRSGD